MATQKDEAKDAKPDAKGGADGMPVAEDFLMTKELRAELDALTGTQRAAVLMLLLGE